jgi:hypothetical protein
MTKAVSWMDPHLSHRYEGEPHEDLVLGLEPDQTVAYVSRPIPAYQMTPALSITLWTVRIVSVLLTIAVAFVFVAGMGGHS